MNCQPTSSFPYFDRLPEPPAEIKAEIQRRGQASQKQPALQPRNAPSFGARIHAREPMRERDLPYSEMLSLLDKGEALRMVYVPHFITQCIMHYADVMRSHAAAHRLSKYKKLGRALALAEREYYASLKAEMPPAVYDRFLSQRSEFIASCGASLQIMLFTFGNELSRKHKRVEDSTMVSYAFIIVSLAQYIEDFDAESNRVLSERLGEPVRNCGDARVRLIKALCSAIVGPYMMPQTEQTAMAMRVIANKAQAMINDML